MTKRKTTPTKKQAEAIFTQALDDMTDAATELAAKLKAPAPEAPPTVAVITEFVGPLPLGGAAVRYVLPSGAVRPAVIVDTNPDATVYLKATTEPGDNARNPLPVPAAPYSADKRPGTWHWPEA